MPKNETNKILNFTAIVEQAKLVYFSRHKAQGESAEGFKGASDVSLETLPFTTRKWIADRVLRDNFHADSQNPMTKSVYADHGQTLKWCNNVANALGLVVNQWDEVEVSNTGVTQIVCTQVADELTSNKLPVSRYPVRYIDEKVVKEYKIARNNVQHCWDSTDTTAKRRAYYKAFNLYPQKDDDDGNFAFPNQSPEGNRGFTSKNKTTISPVEYKPNKQEPF